MAAPSRVVIVNISRSNPTVSQQAFSASLILSAFTYWPDDARSYSSAAGLLTDGFQSSDPAYLAAVDYFSQSPQPSLAIVGRRSVTRVLTIVAAVNTFLYSVTIAGIAYTYTSDGSAILSEIQAGLLAAINAATNVHGLTASNDSGAALFLAPASGTGSCPVITALSAHLSIADGDTVDAIAQDLGRIQRANSSWYGIILADRDNTNASAVAAWTESAAPSHYFNYASDDLNIINDAEETSSLAYLWKAANYTKSTCFYHSLAATRYADAAFLGVILPMNPGSYTGKFKTLTGIPADNLTDNQITTAAGVFTGNGFTAGKNAMVYINVGGVNMTAEGMVAVGEFIDVMIGIDWLASSMTTDVFAFTASQKKVSFTDDGLHGTGAIISKRLDIATGPDFPLLTGNPTPPTVTVPRAASFTPTQKASRVVSGFKFAGTLQGAIHFTGIDGNVTP